MESKTINLNQPVIKSDKGLYIDPNIIQEKVKNEAYEKYISRYTKAENAKAPKIRVAYSYILTKAVPPKLQGFTESGLIINQLEVDVRTLKKLQIMSENVSDEQEVLLKGEHVNDSTVKIGEKVKIDFSRYKRLNDDHTPGVIETGYEIPLYEIEGNEYLLLDSRDILYTIEN